mmetsp:Transcript_28992/g.45632  ORF Transcript_28992/g.45632 Transcript_28992/m.45632 type:complete len:320 (+) Transcript_28992:134-1093(+)
MKIFGKVKSSVDATTPVAEEKKHDSKVENESDVPSYFASAANSSSKKKKSKKNDGLDGDNIQALLEMDFDKLNAKQRRLVKRHRAREGNQEVVATVTKSSPTDDNSPNSNKSEQHEKQPAEEDKANVAAEAPKEEKNKSSMDISEVIKKLDGLNSKERRKFLRQLKSNGEEIDEEVIVAAQEEAKKVAERNEKEAVNSATAKGANDDSSKKKRKAESSGNTDEANKPKKKRRKRGPPVSLDDLPPEERARREEQRRMQKEAAERREAGLVDPTRHPLNSERRRANRRKPSKNKMIAMAKKEKMAEQGKFNLAGYHMRKG